MKQWPRHLIANVFLNLLQRVPPSYHRAMETAMLIWLGSSSASQLDLQIELL